MYTDSHAHLTSPEVVDEVDRLLTRAQGAHVERIVNICTDEVSLEKGIALAQRYPWIYTTGATTPHDVAAEGETFFPVVAKAAKEKLLVALGETGLDYFYEHSDREMQQAFLLRYFTLAQQTKLPLIFHCREAFSDLFALADRHYGSGAALLHCFTGSLEEAKGVIDRGWYLSISGIVTFKKSEALRAVVKYIPLDQLLIETDTPYLAPQSHRGQRNEPAFLPETAACIAQVLGVSVEQIAEATSLNAERFFSFSKLK